MPELPEVEAYRRLLESRALGRRISAVDAPDAWYLKRGLDADTLASVLVGAELAGADRHGKLLVAPLGGVSGDRVLGLRFGMTGRLVVDGHSAVGQLLYSPVRDDPGWDRATVHFADGGSLRMSDPRRLGGVELDPDLDRLGPDALTATLAQVRGVLHGSAAALKARLLDQAKLAGVGNLAGDEILWRAGLAPARPAGGLDDDEVRTLQRRLGSTLRMLIRRGGSHTGDLGLERRPGGRCPSDGAPLRRSTVGGRTSWWCPRHQR